MNSYNSVTSWLSMIFKRPLMVIARYEAWRPYTDKQAWKLFKIAAYAEAVTWTMLLLGIIAKYSVYPPNPVPVSATGQLHGIVFIFYVVAVVAVYPTLKWPRWFMLLAGLASIPPFGTIIVEKWAAFMRRSSDLRTRREVSVKGIIIKNNAALVIQPIDTVEWTLPGGIVQSNESSEQALIRYITDITGTPSTAGSLAYIVEQQVKKVHYMTLYFVIDNPDDYSIQPIKEFIKGARLADEIDFVSGDELQKALPQEIDGSDLLKLSYKSPMATKVIQI